MRIGTSPFILSLVQYLLPAYSEAGTVLHAEDMQGCEISRCKVCKAGSRKFCLVARAEFSEKG